MRASFIDPVCGMTVEPATAAGSTPHGGQSYYFCSSHCLDKFRVNPGQFVASAAPGPPATHVASGEYTCPMHPEVVRDGPGTCPKCGMSLEPMTPSAGGEDDSELRDMQRRLVWATVLTLPLFILAMGPMLFDLRLSHDWSLYSNWLGLALSTPVVFWAGSPFFVRAWQGLRHGAANMFTLISIGTAAAWAFSAVATLPPHVFPPASRYSWRPFDLLRVGRGHRRTCPTRAGSRTPGEEKHAFGDPGTSGTRTHDGETRAEGWHGV